MNEPKFKIKLAEYKGSKLNSKVEELINKLSNTRGIFCECLIDQNRFIGDDPVGHACMRKATRKITTPEGTL